ncbi:MULTISPECIES: hypothetical protein [unclassified Pseudactinotalea]|uniref:hypothetical protein n=1 Tax=unclassified Pseudactinotalea TaxID=2649176 RepID=UPI00128C04DA|nr:MULTISPECIES: hypothetical protein [unclassified Pseudactinotalea]MPV48985.1 hypothetical protein [Pseudactinotalea sp. HY160]QGH68338.1 hypothetical protein GCE65_01530 [Pseudactinotalea sp. HY158]
MRAGERASWNALVRRVPGIGEIPRAESPAVGELVATMQPQGWSREQVLSELETVAAGPAKRAIERARTADQQRRVRAAKDHIPRRALARAVVGLFLIVVGIVLILPDLPALFVNRGADLTSPAYYEFDLDEVAFIAGALMLAGAVLHYALERHRPRALPYPARIYIPYTLFGVIVSGLSIARLLRWGAPGASVVLGVVMCVAATVGFIGLLWYSMRSPSVAHVFAPGTDTSRAFDRRFREDVRAAIHGSEHVHLDSYRAQALDGIRRLYERRLVTEDDAVWMLREIAPEATG